MQQVGQDSQFWLGAPAAPAAKPSSADATNRDGLGKRSLRRLRRSRIRGLGLAIAGLMGAICYTVLTDGGRSARESNPLLPKVEAAAVSLGLGIDQVSITGQNYTADSDIFDALDLPNVRSLASLDAAAATARIEELPWVESATLQRVYPGRLDVKISERKPWAVWRRGKKDLLIDQTGRVLAAVKSGASGMLLFSGEGAAKEAPGLMALLTRYPDVKEQLKGAERVADRRWTLTLKDGNTLVLPPEREAQALSLYASDRTVKSLSASGGYIIDLRGIDKIALRKRTGAGSTAAPPSSPADAKS